MHKEGVGEFPYYLGVDSLSDIATRDDKICVLNILGGESSKVTPTSHVYSGGNVVFGTGPGKSGQVLETPIGDIPVFNSVKEGRKAGYRFNTAVVYLPPSGVKDGVAEAVRQNPDLKKVIVITEKVSVKDSRTIRAICQTNGVDLFGSNCLGVGDSWNKVRIGGALGGSRPDESLIKGSIALFSNSGNFTTTIAVYLLSKGWGTTTCVSSGKDVYIHYGPKEFLHALNNDDRSKASVMYVEPGGYYEHGLQSNKPLVICVVGKWKAKFTRACGHAGSLAGSGDDASAKENWFMDYFGVDGVFTPETPVFSKKGAVVANIAHIPEALTMVMAANKIEPDFENKGNLSLKCWMGNDQEIAIPEKLKIPIVEAVSPYNEQIKNINKIIGAQIPRQNLKDASGTSIMDSKTQVTRVNNVSILEISKHPFESNLVFSLTKDFPGEGGRKLANIVFNTFLNMHGDKTLVASDASRENDNSPNTVLSSAVSIIGKGKVKKSMDAIALLLDLFQFEKGEDAFLDIDFANKLDKVINDNKIDIFLSSSPDSKAEEVLNIIKTQGVESVHIKFLKSLSEKTGKNITIDSIVAAIWMTLGWTSLKKKRVSKATILLLPWYSRIFSTFIAASVDSQKHTSETFCGVKNSELISDWTFTEASFLALIGHRPKEDELFDFTLLLGLIISNGPGTISAQGAKGAVSADGPEQTGRVQVNKCFTGFLTHTGFAHGGNGFEAIEFLVERFKEENLSDPGSPDHGINLRNIAKKYAETYKEYKNMQKSVGNLEYKKIPCINHPIFKNKALNIDPREEFVSKLFKERKSYNIFLDFYHNLVKSLFEAGVSKNIYCVNIDAVIAVILLKIIWNKFKKGVFKGKDMENAAFTLFLYGRMAGCAAEIDDHTNRGKNMDTRTAASKCLFVS